MAAADQTEAVAQENVVQPPQFSFTIASDRMAAYVRIRKTEKDQQVTKEQILEAVRGYGIVYGIDEKAIDAMIASGNFLMELKVAVGKKAVRGEDAYVDFHFRKVVTGMPVEREDGTVDYKNLDLVQNVAEGDVVAEVVPPKTGTPGIDIYGNEVLAQDGDPCTPPIGSNVRYDEETGKILATVGGGVCFRSGVICVEEVYHVKGDVGPKTGSITYNGSVMIHGNVLEGFSVTADEDITVNGMVEGARLESGGNVLIKDGINGMNKAVIRAKGNVSSVFIENATVFCGEDLYANVLMNCTVDVGHIIKLRGNRGAIIGGTYRAGENINLINVGNEKNLTQELFVDPCWYEYYKMGLEERPEDPELTKFNLVERKNALRIQSNKLSDEVKKLQVEKEYQQPISSTEKNKLMRSLLVKKSDISEKIAEIDEQIRECDRFLIGHDFKIVCSGYVYPGTKLIINRARFHVNTIIQNQRFYVSDGEIAQTLVLPNEKD